MTALGVSVRRVSARRMTGIAAARAIRGCDRCSGFVFQAIGRDGTTAAELGRRLGISKQAAAKHIDALEREGYLRRVPDPDDARSKVVMLTERGVDALARSARIFDDLRTQWGSVIGEKRLRALEADLRKLTSPNAFPLDLPGWFGGQ